MSEIKLRILAQSLSLFNSKGFAAQSAFDVASALKISPGHLYYHFKGKNEIAFALINGHIEEMRAIANSAKRDIEKNGANIERMWTHVHIFIEEIYDNAFVYRELAFLNAQEKITPQTRILMSILHDFANFALGELQRHKQINMPEEIKDGLCAQLVTGMAFEHIKLKIMAKEEIAPRILVERAAAITMLPLSGFGI